MMPQELLLWGFVSKLSQRHLGLLCPICLNE